MLSVKLASVSEFWQIRRVDNLPLGDMKACIGLRVIFFPLGLLSAFGVDGFFDALSLLLWSTVVPRLMIT